MCARAPHLRWLGTGGRILRHRVDVAGGERALDSGRKVRSPEQLSYLTR